MNFRDYDRKFWLVVEKGDKKITDLHLPVNGNSFLCYSYYAPEGERFVKPGLVYGAVYGAVYVNGEYSINTQQLNKMTVCYFTKEQLEGYQIIPIDNKAINIVFERYMQEIEYKHYNHQDLIKTRDISFIDEFRREDNPDILKGLLTDMKSFENVWMKIEKLEKVINENTYLFSCEILSEPFTIKGIHQGDKTLGFALINGDKKICGCSVGVTFFYQSYFTTKRKIKPFTIK